MKKQVFYLHGGESYEKVEDFLYRLATKDIWDLPSDTKPLKWTKTFAENLGSDYEVFMPQMPNAQNAKYNEWKIWFERHFEHLRDDVVLAGCSLGAMFLLRYLSENNTPFRVKALFILAAAVPIDDVVLEDSGDFVCDLHLVPTIQERVESVVIMHSQDDFLVSYEHALVLSRCLPKAKLVTFTDKNHFLVEEFPELVEEIKGLG